MGSNSNRDETRNEKLDRLGKKILNSSRDSFDEESSDYRQFQSSTGAEIRGLLGTEKGNQFIKDMKKYRR